MYARMTSLKGSPDDLDAGIATFRESVLPFVRDDGGKGAILLVDRGTGDALGVTFWEDEQALQASEEAASAVRAQAARALGSAGEPTVSRYEVVVFEI